MRGYDLSTDDLKVDAENVLINAIQAQQLIRKYKILKKITPTKQQKYTNFKVTLFSKKIKYTETIKILL